MFLPVFAIIERHQVGSKEYNLWAFTKRNLAVDEIQKIPNYIDPGVMMLDVMLTIGTRPDGSLTITKAERVHKTGVELMFSM